MIRILPLLLAATVLSPAALLFGVRNGTAAVYSYDTTKPGTSSLLFTATSANTTGFTGTTINSLAVNDLLPEIIYFTDSTYTSGMTSAKVFYFNRNTNSGGLLTSISFPSTTAGASPLDSGAAFYKGALYVAVEDIYSPGVGSSRMVQIPLNSGGTSVSGTVTNITFGSTTNGGNFGDFVINPVTGVVTGSSYGSSLGTSTQFWNWRFDLKNTAAGFTGLANLGGSANGYQLALDGAGMLWGGNSTNIVRIDPVTGTVISGSSQTGFGFAVSDMASVSVPEPNLWLATGVVLCGLGLARRFRATAETR